MRGRKSPLQAEAIRLRIEERLSLREIHERIGVPKGSLSAWLKPYPLTWQEKLAKNRAGRPRGRRKARGEESKHHQAVANDLLTKHDRARIAEAAVLFRLALHRFKVLRSVFDGHKADWVVETEDGHIYKIQVKCASGGQRGLPLVRLLCNTAGRGTMKRTYRLQRHDHRPPRRRGTLGQTGVRARRVQHPRRKTGASACRDADAVAARAGDRPVAPTPRPAAPPRRARAARSPAAARGRCCPGPPHSRPRPPRRAARRSP
jgi:hypothetical protein